MGKGLKRKAGQSVVPPLSDRERILMVIMLRSNRVGGASIKYTENI